MSSLGTSRRGALSRGAAGRGASRGGGWEEESDLDEWGRQRHREVEGHDPCGAPAERQPFAQAWFGTTAVGYVDVSPPPIGSIGRDRRLEASSLTVFWGGFRAWQIHCWQASGMAAGPPPFSPPCSVLYRPATYLICISACARRRTEPPSRRGWRLEARC